jgi:hypothetical protein
MGNADSLTQYPMADEIPNLSRDDDLSLFRQVLVAHGGPAFLRSSHQVWAAYEQLLDDCRKQRNECW